MRNRRFRAGGPDSWGLRCLNETRCGGGDWLSRPGLHLCKDYDATCLHGECSRCAKLSAPVPTLHDLRCHRRAGGAPAQNASDRPILWLHIPKCGSTFSITVLHYACAEELPAWHLVFMALLGNEPSTRMAHALHIRHAAERPGWACGRALRLPFLGHKPLTPESDRIVAMFRRPAQRIISAWVDHRHADGMEWHVRRTLPKNISVADFARFEGIAGCATKLLTGSRCAASVSIDDARVDRAVATLRSGRFAFVGLVERWDESVCLFHATMGVGSYPIAGELQHFGHSRAALRRPGGRYDEGWLRGFVDTADERVYAEAVAVFDAQRAAHGYGYARRAAAHY